MASSLPHSSLPCLSISPSPGSRSRSRSRPRVSIRAQRFRNDDGRSPSRNVVDANLGTLRRRIKETKAKERTERCCRYEIGWDYMNHERRDAASVARGSARTSEGFELVLLVFGNMGLTVAGGTLVVPNFPAH
ncbi:hypothetical protein MLD38_022808 [Melastoma candidum]|uniref:Uncharacterized protein n=2 Tax=Melastoma candidum TaxID=119954 RepID=A0ACB9QKJ8_9MYRT|nr:hypothetical protein MLD38_022804 [Melastoma candidum]KAI4367021.1 hypothetical protein MLD38_022808 [Melastoma candidum]